MRLTARVERPTSDYDFDVSIPSLRHFCALSAVVIAVLKDKKSDVKVRREGGKLLNEREQDACLTTVRLAWQRIF